MIALDNAAQLPKRRNKAPAIPANIAAAIQEYEAQYKRVYKRTPAVVYEAGYVRIDNASGIMLKRLKELTRMLKDSQRG